MNTTLLNILLYLPFGSVALVTGIIFLFSGYRKGPWRALLSLGLTIVATALSLLLAKLLSFALTKPILRLLPTELLAEAGTLSGLLESMVQGVLQVALSFLFFASFLFTFLLVLKIIGNKIKTGKLAQLDAWDTSKQSMRFAGMAIRALDAVLVTFLLLLPFYSIPAAAAAPISTVIQWMDDSRISETNDTPSTADASGAIPGIAIPATADAAEEGESSGMTEVAAYLQCVADHPIVSIYKSGPAAWINATLSSFDVGNASINLTNVASLLEQVIELLERCLNTDGTDRIEACRELSTYLRENIVQEQWCYDLVCGVKNEFVKQLDNLEDPELQKEIELYLELFDMTQDEFESNGVAILDFISYSLEYDFIEFYEDGNYERLNEEFLLKFGSLLNHSQQSIALKKIILENSAESFLFHYATENDSDSEQNAAWESARDAATKAAQDFVDRYFGDGNVPADKQRKEAEAFLLLLFEGSVADTLEAFARHPLFGADSVSGYVTEQSVLESYSYGSAEEIQSILDTYPQMKEALLEKLKSYETAPFTNERFSDYLSLVSDTVQFITSDQENFYGYYGFQFRATTEALTFLLNGFGENFFSNSQLVAGDEVDIILKTALEKSLEPDYQETDLSIGYLYDLMKAAKSSSGLWPDKIPDTSDPEVLNSSLFETYHVFTARLQSVMSDAFLCSILEDCIEENGNDPMDLGSHLSPDQKKCFAELLELSYEKLYVDPETAVQGSTESGITDGSIVTGGSDGHLSMGSSNAMMDGNILIIHGGSGGLAGGRNMTTEEIQAYNSNLEKSIPILKQFFGIA